MGINISGKIKAAVGGGMRVTGTVVASNAAGANFSCYYGSLPQSSQAASSSAGPSALDAGQLPGLVAAPAAYISIVDRGAVSSSTASDSLTAIKNAISAAQLTAHRTVFIPAGDYAYTSTFTATAVAIVGVGPTSILRAVNTTSRAIYLKGSSAMVKHCTLLTNGTTTRGADWPDCGIVNHENSNWVIENVAIRDTGNFAIGNGYSTSSGVVTQCTISHSYADSIHNTIGAHNITIYLNRIMGGGDDGISCVSYHAPDGVVSNVEAYWNWISDNYWGRGMTVIGGQNINFHNNLIQDNSAQFAGILIAQENSFNTYAAISISVTYNTIINCGGNSTGHSNLMILDDGASTNSAITVVRNRIQGNGTANGIIVYGPMKSVTLDSNQITSASASYAVNSTASPDTVITLYTTGNTGYAFTTP